MQSVSNFANIAWETIKRGALQARFYLAAATTWIAAQQPLIIAAIIIIAATVVTLLAIALWPKSKSAKATEEAKPLGKKSTNLEKNTGQQKEQTARTVSATTGTVPQHTTAVPDPAAVPATTGTVPQHTTAVPATTRTVPQPDSLALQLAQAGTIHGVDQVTDYRLVTNERGYLLDLADIRAKAVDGVLAFHYVQPVFLDCELLCSSPSNYFLSDKISRDFISAVESYNMQQIQTKNIELYRSLVSSRTHNSELDRLQIAHMLIHNLCGWDRDQQVANIEISLKNLAVRFSDSLNASTQQDSIAEADRLDTSQIAIDMISTYNLAMKNGPEAQDQFFTSTAQNPEDLTNFLALFAPGLYETPYQKFQFKPNDPLLDALHTATSEERGFDTTEVASKEDTLPALKQIISYLRNPFGSTMLIQSASAHWETMIDTLSEITMRIATGEIITRQQWTDCIQLLKQTMYQFNETEANPIKEIINILNKQIKEYRPPVDDSFLELLAATFRGDEELPPLAQKNELLAFRIGNDTESILTANVTKHERVLPDLIGALESLADGKTLSVTAKTLFPLDVDLPAARPAASPGLEGGANRDIQIWGGNVAIASSSSESVSHSGSELHEREPGESLSGRSSPAPSLGP